MKQPETIESFSVKTRPYLGRFFTLRLSYTEIDDTIHDLRSSDIDGHATINGTPCRPGRVFTKESFDKIMEKFKNG
jgi:hypothetical protein